MSPQTGKPKKKPGNGIPLPIVILIAAVVAAGIWMLLTPRTATAKHPTPRPGITAAKVLPATNFAQPDVAQTYAEAKEIPEVLDGIYCHCDCSISAGHRSLLTCFESEHGSNCDICLEEARLAHEMHRQGKTLQQIRVAIDARFTNHV